MLQKLAKVKIESIKRSVIVSKNKYNILVEEEGDNDNKDNIKEVPERSIENKMYIIIDIFCTRFSSL